MVSKQQTTLKPRLVTFVKIDKEDREILTEPLCDTAVCQLIPALYKRVSKVAVLNGSDNAVKIKNGTPLGFLSKGNQAQLNEFKENKENEAVHGLYENEEYNETDKMFKSVVEGNKVKPGIISLREVCYPARKVVKSVSLLGCVAMQT